MRVTLNYVAKYCNVSKGTVGRVINNRPGVNPKTKEKVESAIRELGFTPHFFAQSLAKGKSMSIGVLLFNLNNMFFSQLSNSIVKTADELGYYPYLMLSGKNKDREFDCIKNFVSHQVDGVILFSTNNDQQFLEYLRKCPVPIITVMTQLEDFTSVGIDDYQAMYDATKYVLSKGYERILYISPPLSYVNNMNIKVQQLRHQGFLDALKKTDTQYNEITEYNYLQAIDKIRFGSDKKTAFICTSDIYALNIVRHMKLRGFSSPYDFGVMGFDNIDTLQYIDPSIATVSVPVEEIGRQAVNILVDAINGKPVGNVILPYSTIAGQTIV